MGLLCQNCQYRRSQGSLVSIVTRLHAGQPRNRDLILSGVKGFFLLGSMKTVSETHPASIVVGMSVNSPWI